MKSLIFYIPEAWKRYPFWAEPPRIGHYREYPPPLPWDLAILKVLERILPSFHTVASTSRGQIMHSVTRPGLGLNILFYSMIWLGNPKRAPFWILCCSWDWASGKSKYNRLVVVMTVMETRSVFVLATVVSIRDKFCYPCCTRCRKKVHTIEDDATWVKLVFSYSCSNKMEDI